MLCAWCQKEFTYRLNGRAHNRKRRFCSQSCANSAKANLPESREASHHLIKYAQATRPGSKRPDVSQRMKHNNPMSDPDALEKMRQKLVGRTFLARGGNGVPTTPQLMLAQALTLPIEYPIPTAPVKSQFPSLPSCYKVDIADPEHQVAIEVDGRTHREKRWKFLGCSHGRWWINRSALCKPPSGCFSSVGSPNRPPHLGVRPRPTSSAGTFTHLPVTRHRNCT
jgi:hypothetical protein